MLTFSTQHHHDPSCINPKPRQPLSALFIADVLPAKPPVRYRTTSFPQLCCFLSLPRSHWVAGLLKLSHCPHCYSLIFEDTDPKCVNSHFRMFEWILIPLRVTKSQLISVVRLVYLSGHLLGEAKLTSLCPQPSGRYFICLSVSLSCDPEFPETLSLSLFYHNLPPISSVPSMLEGTQRSSSEVLPQLPCLIGLLPSHFPG